MNLKSQWLKNEPLLRVFVANKKTSAIDTKQKRPYQNGTAFFYFILCGWYLSQFLAGILFCFFTTKPQSPQSFFVYFVPLWLMFTTFPGRHSYFSLKPRGHEENTLIQFFDFYIFKFNPLTLALKRNKPVL